MPQIVSIQGKCRSGHSNNSKDDHDVGRSILQTQIVFFLSGNKEEGIIVFLSSH